MAEIILRFSVDADPTLTDPGEVADHLFSFYDAAGSQNHKFDLASDSLEADWVE